MSEAWLHNNRRLLLPLALPAALVGLGGLACLALGIALGAIWVVAGAIAIALAAGMLLAAWLYLRRPRLEYEPGWLLLHLGWSRTIPIPIEIVECFFMGHAPSLVRGPGGKEAETATVVIRLAERAKQWHARDIAAYLGQWCEGYIIVRGTWCEPINMELLERLNELLAQAHRAQKLRAEAE